MLKLLTTEFAPFFTAPAVLGTAFFALRLLLMLIGAADGHFDVAHAAGAGDLGHGGGGGADALHMESGDAAGGIDAHHGDAAHIFRFLSLQSILAFAMGFGWAGLGAYRSFELSAGLSVLVALAGGFAVMWLLALLMKAVYDLQSSGNINPRDAIGHEGFVYLGIPAPAQANQLSSKSGQVRVTVNDRQRIYDAVEEPVSADGHLGAGAISGIPTGTRVRIVGVDGGHTLRVVRA